MIRVVRNPRPMLFRYTELIRPEIDLTSEHGSDHTVAKERAGPRAKQAKTKMAAERKGMEW